MDSSGTPIHHTLNLNGGEDLRDHATVIIQFDSSKNYAKDETINLNGTVFTFKIAGTEALDTDVALDTTNLASTMKNFITAVNNIGIDASLKYDSGLLTITHKEAGVAGNSFSSNLGGGTAEYTVADGGILSTDSNIYD